jgi:sulfur carrier protein
MSGAFPEMTATGSPAGQDHERERENITLSVFNAQTGTRGLVTYRRKVHRLLKDLGFDPETVLVIQGDQLLTQDDTLSPDTEVEIRPVISGGSR